jgi:hypothetical protein
MIQTYADLISSLINTRTDFFTGLQETRKNYPKIKKEKDARITFFSKSIVIIDSVTLCFIFADRHLSNNRWWVTSANMYHLNSPPVNSRTAIIEGFRQFILLGFFHFMFSAMESSIRLIAKKVDNVLYEKTQRNFENIYQWLVRALQLKNRYVKLMDILRLIRNTIHNNGVYSPVPKKGRQLRDRQMSWKGVRCKFPVNKNVKADDFWRLVFATVPDTLSMMRQIIDSSQVSHISSIKDPSVEKSLIPIFFPEDRIRR